MLMVNIEKEEIWNNFEFRRMGFLGYVRKVIQNGSRFRE